MEANQYIIKLLELSDKKLEGLREILRLTEKQSIIITDDAAGELQALIDLKQVQMDMIDELDQAFEVYYGRLKSILGVYSIEEIRMSELDHSAELKQVITSIFNVTKQIQTLENENNNRVKEILDKLSGEIRQVKQGKLVNSGYNIGGKLPQQSYYFDKKK